MKKFLLLAVIFAATSLLAFAQDNKVSGVVKDEFGSPIPNVNVVIQSTFRGTTTDANGMFSLLVKPNSTLIFTSIGYIQQTLPAPTSSSPIEIVLQGSRSELDEVIVSASRIEERLLEAPVTVTKVSAKQILAGGGPELFSTLGHFPGVDVNSSSMLFTAISTRGFNSPKSERMIQLADYVDTQVPSLNLNAGNMLGVPELDISSVEIIHGPASALYGANAFNGVLITNSKDPFYSEGLSVKLKGGSRSLFDGQIRYAKKLSDKFAFKINATYFTADDWMADDFSPKRINSAPNNAPGSPFGYDALNKYGEISTEQANLVIVPGQVIYTPGWSEAELINGDNKTTGYRFNPNISYLITDNLKATLDYKTSGGTTSYQSTSRYRLKNLRVDQFKAELKSDNWFVRGFRTVDYGKDSYDLSFLGARMATLNPTAAGLPALPGGAPSYAGLFFGTYGGALQQGATPEQAYAAAAATWPTQGSEAFNALREYNAELNQPAGARLPVNSILSDISGQYDFKLDVLDLIVGGAYRTFALSSQGSVFEDVPGGDRIKNHEYGFYGQAAKSFFDNQLKLQVASRIDFFKNFDSKLSPRASAVYTFGEKRQNNFRTSYATAFRSPAQIDQFIQLDIGNALLLGNVKNGFEGYNTNMLTEGNPVANITAVAGGSTEYNFSAARLDLEQVKTWEIGYKSVIGEKAFIDISYYRSLYNNFIGAQPFVGNRDGSRPTIPETLVAVGAAQGADGEVRNRLNDPNSQTRIMQVWFNNDQEIKTQGLTLAAGYNFMREFNVNANYTYSKMSDVPDGFLAYYNTPENKFNIGIDGEIINNLSYTVNYKWQDGFNYEYPFDIGPIDKIATLDASISYNLGYYNSAIQVGGSNLTNAYNKQIFGGPQFGRMVFAGVSFHIN
ncbi:MAG TPA: TonB-dependent receptor plug domain-containing protein [Sphingobacteriaceae bacterium]|nr:TonB-dependent receptor plug domain-containing protein [Sphingobacteriaceae bacterium]